MCIRDRQNTLREMANCVIEETDNTAAMLVGGDHSIRSPSKLDLSSMEYDNGDTFDENGDMDDINSMTSNSSFNRSGKQGSMGSGGRRSTSPSRMARMRSMSPVRARSPAVADSAVSMAKSALKKRQLQIQVCFLFFFCFFSTFLFYFFSTVSYRDSSKSII